MTCNCIPVPPSQVRQSENEFNPGHPNYYSIIKHGKLNIKFSYDILKESNSNCLKEFNLRDPWSKK